MPADFTIDTERETVFSEATGVFTLGDALSHVDRLIGHPDFKPVFNQIIDFRQATGMALSCDDVRNLAKQNIFSADSRRPFLVTPGVQFGLGRVFATYRELEVEQGIRIFTDANEARSSVSRSETT
jgi:hypothetical protein